MSAFSKWFFYISFCIGLESQRFTTTLLNGKNNQICLFSVLQCWARFDQSSIDFIAISSTKWSLMNFLNELCLSSPLHCAFQFIWRLLKNRLFFSLFMSMMSSIVPFRSNNSIYVWNSIYESHYGRRKNTSQKPNDKWLFESITSSFHSQFSRSSCARCLRHYFFFIIIILLQLMFRCENNGLTKPESKSKCEV